MRAQSDFPSAALLDSGGGWFGDCGGGCLVFRKPQFSLFSTPEGAVLSRAGKNTKITGDPVREIEKITRDGYVAVGFFGYEYLKNTHDGRGLKARPKKEESGDILSFHFYPEKSVAQTETFSSEPAHGNIKNFSWNSPDRDAERRFTENVKKIKSRIENGDVYQVNISEQWNFSAPQNPYRLFLKLFDSQPVPFAVYMDFGRFQFLSGSMELFLRRNGKTVVSRPIKGTVRRGNNLQEDSEMARALAENDKEKAEILMITDLMRNDLSRVCIPSTVRTGDIFSVKKYETLFHMESEVKGDLKPEVSLEEIIKKTLPPGSVTGAPKTAALHIIEDLEPHARGPYCGTAGIFYPNGDFCLSVSIRCLRISGGEGVCWSGAGIVWDSDEQKEFEEIKLKLKALQNVVAGEKVFL